MLDARWRPVHPDSWMLPDPCDDYWPIVTEGHQQDLFEHFAQFLTSDLWQRASLFFEGSGLASGPDLTVPKSMLKRFQDAGRQADYGLLSAVCVGDLWPAARKTAQGMLLDSTCPRCGKEPETLTHRHWQCEANGLIMDPAVANTQHLSERAISGSESTPCFWNRGIVPTEWTTIPAPSETQPLFGHGDWARFGDATVLYTDASGGNHTKDKRLRRVGWAVAAVSEGERPEFLAAKCGPLPGPKQSVSRGELFAVVEALKLADPAKPLQIVSDCMYVVLGSTKTKVAPNQRHADLWNEFVKLKAGYTNGLTVRHVQSHIPAQLLWAGTVDKMDFVGNTLADAFAARAAAECQLFEGQIGHIKKTDKLCKQVLLRIMAITRVVANHVHASDHLPQNECESEPDLWLEDSPLVPPVPVPRKRKYTMEDRIRELSKAGHSLCWRKPRLHCTRCLQAFTKSKLREWADSGPCPGLQRRSCVTTNTQAETGNDLASAPVVKVKIASSTWHSSHRAYQKRGYIWCWKCGAWGSTKPGKLRKPCAMVPSKAGKEVLTRVRRGLTPKSHAKWLFQEDEAPPEGLVEPL